MEHSINFWHFYIIVFLSAIGVACFTLIIIWSVSFGIQKIKSRIESCIKPSVKQLNAKIKKLENTDDISDGYHTFEELYDFRREYHAAFVNTSGFKSIKSFRHANGEKCFGGGWFIVQTWIPNIGQISNHYESRYWDLFHCECRDRAELWDGHTPQDVLNRLDIMNTDGI